MTYSYLAVSILAEGSQPRPVLGSRTSTLERKSVPSQPPHTYILPASEVAEAEHLAAGFGFRPQRLSIGF